MSSPDPNLYSDPPIQDLQDMPEDIQHISACFREYNLETKLWSQEFDNIILEMHRIATTDFVKTYCDFLSQDNEPVKSKIKRLEQFKEKLCNIFGDGGETLVTFAKKLDSLGRNVQTFGIRLKHLPGNHKENLETVFEDLKTQMNRINSEFISSKEFEKEDLNKKLQDIATGECCKKIESIKAQLKCIKRVWMILCSDVEGLLTLLQLTIGDDDSDCF
ncbi:uncharacterized protein FOMMEDRAFT_30883 [Fomitiporia mediterranea MF3/22]|uniref:uncharacterized protein n=1 Tax=Fomitiporia mediterranea (strain MF3/22) TaxID=694068 RepID=UPI0004409BC1|nr:uncharacterized protein FOMMEDRAFT_30883 [Fomitiporia mediterranea MF3/22]EJD00250.1 hypothetical protein FOMMEDRAFT_30883 [Fomitiporia mediterranea MF3/22]